jgi:sterol 24-C-methyltransferase
VNSSIDQQIKRVRRYYDHTESRVGYTYLLHGTKHFGWYEAGQSMWSFSSAMRRMEDELGRRLGLPSDSEVLDAGCGVGDVARTMADKYQLDVTGIDILDFNLDEARKRGAASNIARVPTFQFGDYHHLYFSDESFDGVYTMETLVHAGDPFYALAAALSCLSTRTHLRSKWEGQLILHFAECAILERCRAGSD